VCENPDIKVSLYPVTASDDNSMFPSFNEFIVENDFPLRMHELPVTESHEHVVRDILASYLFDSEIFERIW
jgi:hypothetical protein